MRAIAAALAWIVAVAALPADAQTFPSRTIRIVVPTVPGGTTDLLARMLADTIATKSGAQAVVENRPGAGGMLGAESVAKSEPDGATLVFHNSGVVITPQLRKSAAFDVMRDLVPVGIVGEAPQLLVVNADLPARSLSEFVALARAKAGQFNYGSAGVGSTPHLAGDQFARLAGITMTHIPYGGMAAAVTDVARGSVQMISISMGPVAAMLEAKKLRILATATSQRLPSLPDIPTAAEAGLPGYEMTTWFALFAPRATPRAVVERLNGYIADMLSDPAAQKRLADNHVEPIRLSQPEFDDFLRKDVARWEQVVRASGIQQ